jgi:predicted HicB family RNase H-like nuclease
MAPGRKSRHKIVSENLMFDCCSPFDDGRGRYPGRLTVHVPRGVREAVSVAAAKESISAAEFARRALMRAVEDQGVAPQFGGSDAR